jgi:hypothetical protein
VGPRWRDEALDSDPDQSVVEKGGCEGVAPSDSDPPIELAMARRAWASRERKAPVEAEEAVWLCLQPDGDNKRSMIDEFVEDV